MVVNESILCVISLGFRREVDENCVLLGYYAASSGNFLPTFRDNLSVPSSRVKNSTKAGKPDTGLYKEEGFLLSDAVTTVPFSSAAL